MSVACLAAVDSHADELNIYIWDRYLADRVIVDFQAETGHTISEDYYDSEAVRDAVITSGRGMGFDLILMDHANLRILAGQDLFTDLAELAGELGAGVIDPRWQDTCGSYGIPYSYGVMGLLYRESVARVPLNSWRQLFEPPPEHRGRVVMFSDTLYTPAVALLAVGAEPFTADVEDLRRAYALMQAQLPSILAWQYGISYGEIHGSASTMSLSFGYNGDENGLRLTTGQRDWKFLVPREGSVLWTDCLAVPAGKTASPAIRQFLEFINRPEVAAFNAEDIGFASPNLRAAAYYSDAQRRRMEMLEDADVRAVAVSMYEMGFEAMRTRDRMMKALLQRDIQ